MSSSSVVSSLLIVVIGVIAFSHGEDSYSKKISPLYADWLPKRPSFQDCPTRTRYYFRTTITSPGSNPSRVITSYVTRTQKILEKETEFVTNTNEIVNYVTKTEVVYLTHTEAKLFSVTNYVTTTLPCRGYQISRTYYSKQGAPQTTLL